MNLDLMCPWCGEEFPDQETYDIHYRPCFIYNDPGPLTKDEVFGLIYNENNY